MIRPEFRKQLQDSLGRVLRILWIGMLGTPVILIGAALLRPLRQFRAVAGGGEAAVAVLDGLSLALLLLVLRPPCDRLREGLDRIERSF